jgi:hypothetical protein
VQNVNGSAKRRSRTKGFEMSEKSFVQGDLMFVKRFDEAPTRDPNHRYRRADSPLSPDRWMVDGKAVEPVGGYYVLARGEKTGHSHKVEVGDHVEVVDIGNKAEMPANDLVLALWEGAEVIHEEHPPLKLEPGTYLVRQQREFDPYAVLRDEQERARSRAEFD